MASSDNSTQSRWKGLVSEEDIASVLTRYSASAKLALLKEVAQFPDVIIDRNVLVKKTTTGIIDAREYPMLWRHLAYCDKLPEAVDEKLEERRLNDEDSDLEYELEAFPPVTDEASLEAAACVKVLLASGLSDDEEGGSIPTWRDSKSPLDYPHCKEDKELIAAVKKLGERNWANILKADIFKGDRTASQLSQRWGIIRNTKNKLTEQRHITNLVITHAASMPMNNILSASMYDRPRKFGGFTLLIKRSEIPLQTPKGTSGVMEKARSITKRTAPVIPNPDNTSGDILHTKCIHIGVTPPLTPNHSGARPNVHYICTGLSSASPSTYSTAVPSVSPPPPTPPVKCKVTSVSVLSTASTSCGTVASGRKTNRVTSAGVGNKLEEEKSQNLHKEVVKNSSNEEEAKYLSKKEQIKPVEMIIYCSADIAKDGKQDDQVDSDMVIGDQTTQNLSKLLTVEAAASDPNAARQASYRESKREYEEFACSRQLRLVDYC
ncbi:hypothetical protein MKW92_004066 [Papaver armeniacum]|nr:hypothetical protein MKW92_004066 [Papaver armeniacum]